MRQQQACHAPSRLATGPRMVWVVSSHSGEKRERERERETDRHIQTGRQTGSATGNRAKSDTVICACLFWSIHRLSLQGLRVAEFLGYTCYTLDAWWSHDCPCLGKWGPWVIWRWSTTDTAAGQKFSPGILKIREDARGVTTSLRALRVFARHCMALLICIGAPRTAAPRLPPTGLK